MRGTNEREPKKPIMPLTLDSLLTAPLLTTPAMQAVLSDTARLAAMLRAEAALARVQARAGLVPEGLAPAIEAIDPASLDAAAIGAATALSGVPTIPFVRAVQARLPPALERHFHKGATTQDILDTATALQLQAATALLRNDLFAILDGLATLADTHRRTPCAGRTYGQHAAPITFGFRVAVWLTGLAEAAADLPRIALPASLAGPVGTLAGLGAHGPAIADAFALELGLAPTPLAWHTRRHAVATAGFHLAALIGAAAKMATDVAHLASTEVSEAAEPYLPGRGGSSAMPHKRNPVSCTVILAAHAAAPGHVATLLGAMAAQHERPPGLWHAEWHALPTLLALAAGALHEARTLAQGLEPDPARMRQNLDATNGLLFADAAAARLSPLGRELAHTLVEHAATKVRDTGRPLQQILAEDPRTQGIDLTPAFDLTPSIEAAQPWIDRAIRAAKAPLLPLLPGEGRGEGLDPKHEP